MKCFAVFLVAVLVASASALPADKTESQSMKTVIDDIIALQKCINLISGSIQTLTSDILTEIRQVEALIGKYSNKATDCFKGVSEDPTVPEQVKIVECLRNTYKSFSDDLYSAVAKIEESVHSLVNLPADLEKCMTGGLLRQ